MDEPNCVPRCMNAKEEPFHTVIGYMCLIDFECELGAAEDGNRVYPSIASLKKHHVCSAECGIAEVRVTAVRVVLEGTQGMRPACLSRRLPGTRAIR